MGRLPHGFAPLASAPMLRLPADVLNEMIAHAYDGLPDEACGLLVGRPDDAEGEAEVVRFVATRNAAASSKVYTVDPRDHLRADREAEADGYEVIGVMHSHTHTEAYPSPTDVAQAPDPGWHYVIVSLKRPDAALRSYRIEGGEVAEEVVELAGR